MSMLRATLLCGSLCGVAALFFQAGSKARPLATAFWPCKNGDLRRSGASLEVGPRTLSTQAWNFRETLGYGAIESTPVIDGKFNTFITSTAGGVFALRRNGSLLWSQRLQGRVMTPAFLDGVLYVGTSKGTAHAFDAATGAERWRTQYTSQAGSDAWSVTAEDGVVLVPGQTSERDDGNYVVFALNASDGSTLWSFKPVVANYNFMPAVVERSAIFVDRAGGMYRLGLGDGKVVWQTQGYGGDSFSTGGLALTSNGKIFATSNRDGHGVIHAHSLKDGTLLWTQNFEMEASAAPAVLEDKGSSFIIVTLGKNPGMGNTGFVHHGMILALDTATGAQRWSFTPPLHFGLFAKGVTQGLGGHMEAFSLPDTWSNPAVGADGTVYVGWMGGILFAIDGHTGAEVSRHDVGLSFQGEPAIAPGFLVVASIYKVVAFDADHKGVALRD